MLTPSQSGVVCCYHVPSLTIVFAYRERERFLRDAFLHLDLHGARLAGRAPLEHRACNPGLLLVPHPHRRPGLHLPRTSPSLSSKQHRGHVSSPYPLAVAQERLFDGVVANQRGVVERDGICRCLHLQFSTGVRAPRGTTDSITPVRAWGIPTCSNLALPQYLSENVSWCAGCWACVQLRLSSLTRDPLGTVHSSAQG